MGGGGLVFAKRKRSPFKGPMLNVGGATGSPTTWRGNRVGDSGSRNHSVQGRRSGEIMGITEEDEEEEEEDMEIEEVDEFSPVLKDGEFIEEVEEKPPATPPKDKVKA